MRSEKDLKWSEGLSRLLRIRRFFERVLRDPESFQRTGPCIIREYVHVGTSCQGSMG